MCVTILADRADLKTHVWRMVWTDVIFYMTHLRHSACKDKSVNCFSIAANRQRGCKRHDQVKQLIAGEFTRGAGNAVQTILKTEGVRGMFAGYGSFMLRDLPFDAIEFVAYEQLKKAWVKYNGSDIRPHESAVIGNVAAVVYCDRSHQVHN